MGGFVLHHLSYCMEWRIRQNRVVASTSEAAPGEKPMKPRLFVISVHLCLAGLLITNTWTRADDASVSFHRPDHCLHVVAPDDIKERFGEHVPHPAFWEPDGWVKRGQQASRGFSPGEMVPLEGTYRMPVIIFGYQDYPIPDGLIERAHEVCEAQWPQRSVSSFYQHASNGIFRIEFDFFRHRCFAWS